LASRITAYLLKHFSFAERKRFHAARSATYFRFATRTRGRTHCFALGSQHNPTLSEGTRS